MAAQKSLKNIPDAFVKNLPKGLKIKSVKGQRYVVVEECRCPKGHSLMADGVAMHGEPAISFKVKGGGVSGVMYLDPFWGLHEKLFDFMFHDCGHPPVIQAFCPVCGVSLLKKKGCAVKGCAADETIVFQLPGGNAVDVCAQWGCPDHDLKISDMPVEVMAAVKKINYPDIHSHSEAMGF